MKTLRNFFETYQVWLDNGAPHLQPYSRGLGLCINICAYMEVEKVPNKLDFEKALKNLLNREFSNSGFPFNDSGTYTSECMHLMSYRNTERNKFVLAQLGLEQYTAYDKDYRIPLKHVDYFVECGFRRGDQTPEEHQASFEEKFLEYRFEKLPADTKATKDHTDEG